MFFGVYAGLSIGSLLTLMLACRWVTEFEGPKRIEMH
jgi:hypothetical protein